MKKWSLIPLSPESRLNYIDSMTPYISFCNVASMPVRSEPSHKAEQVNQLLFGEKALITEVNNREWAKIRSVWDNYQGWCKLSQLTPGRPNELKKDVPYIVTNNKGKFIQNEYEIALPAGAELVNLKRGYIGTENNFGLFKGKRVKKAAMEATPERIVELAKMYFNAPYVWGGRTVAGIDCSGLTQTVFKMCNVKLPRDASQQAEEGQLVEFLQSAKTGDLAFFDNPEGAIVHVGILLDNTRIIHAADTAGRVVIDKIDQGGIISISRKMRTHNLRFVKRILGVELAPKESQDVENQLPLL